MEKQTKLGELRRSFPIEWFSSPMIKTVHSRWYEQLPQALFYLFNAYGTPEIELKDKELISDIELCKKIISRIESFERTKSPRQKYKGFPQKEIHLLNTILRGCPLTIGIDFGVYSEIKEKNFLTSAKKVKKLKENKRQPKLRFYPFPFEVEFPTELNDKGCRHLLTVGLFDYLQRLILREPGRVRKCNDCDNWFIMTRSDNFSCSKACKDSHWLKHKGGREQRKEYMQKYRQKKGKRNSQ